MPTRSLASLAEELGLTPEELLTLIAQARLDMDPRREAAPGRWSTTGERERQTTGPAQLSLLQGREGTKPTTGPRSKPAKSQKGTYASAMSQLLFVQFELENSMEQLPPQLRNTLMALLSTSNPSSLTATPPSDSPAPDRTKTD